MTDKPEIITFIAPVSDTCDIDSYQLCVLACDHESAIAVMDAKIAGENDRARLLLDAKNGWTDRARAAEAQRNELLGLLRDMLRTDPTVSCHSFHHATKDLHGDCEECPVMSRYENAREAAQKYLERHKC